MSYGDKQWVGKVTSANITLDPVLSSFVMVEGDGHGQGFGGWHLGGPCLAAWVKGICETLEVENWQSVVGQIVRVEGTTGKLSRLGHAYKDKWFDPEAAFAAAVKEARNA